MADFIPILIGTITFRSGNVESEITVEIYSEFNPMAVQANEEQVCVTQLQDSTVRYHTVLYYTVFTVYKYQSFIFFQRKAAGHGELAIAT